MASPKALDQRLAAARTFGSLVSDNGSSWWAAFDGLQLSPTEPFGGPAFRGQDRLILALAALDRGYCDRRWSVREALREHGLIVTRGERPVALGDSDGSRLVFNAGQVHAARGRRSGHALEAEALHGLTGTSDIAFLCRALISGAPCRVLLDHCEDAVYDPIFGVVLAPSDPRWGRCPKDLQALLEAVALSLASTGIHGIEGDAECGLVASIASAMALSDLGIAPSMASVAQKHEDRRACGSLPWAEAAADVEVLLSCADAADGLSGLLAGVLVDAVGNGDAADDAAGTDADGGEEANRQDDRLRDVSGTDGCATDERVATGEEDSIPYGRYTLKDTVFGARHASDALSGRLMGASGG